METEKCEARILVVIERGTKGEFLDQLREFLSEHAMGDNGPLPDNFGLYY